MSDIIGVAAEFPSGSVECWHCHRDGQLLFPVSGTMRVEVRDQSWSITPQCALWIPPQTPHEGVFRTNVNLCALYFRDRPGEGATADSEVRLAAGSRPQLSFVSPLLREVIIAIARIGGYSGSAKGERMSLLSGLLANEAANCSHIVGAVALPRNERLRRVCARMVAQPSREWTIDECANRAAMSRRTFTRAFRAETGMSLGEWWRATRLNEAAVKLRAGKSVSTVAYEVGYGSPAAFSTSFRSYFGVSPSVF